jgi:putative membrane protein insertion efficiency factor
MKPAAYLLRGLVLAYRGLLSPLLPGTCRFDPSCSRYALDALSRFGAWHGGRLAAARLLRCHPWGPWGFDPVPEADPGGRPRRPHRVIEPCTNAHRSR